MLQLESIIIASFVGEVCKELCTFCMSNDLNGISLSWYSLFWVLHFLYGFASCILVFCLCQLLEKKFCLCFYRCSFSLVHILCFVLEC